MGTTDRCWSNRNNKGETCMKKDIKSHLKSSVVVIGKLCVIGIALSVSIECSTAKPAQTIEQNAPISEKRKPVSSEDIRRAKAKIFRLFAHCGFFNVQSTSIKAKEVCLLIEETQSSNLKCLESALNTADIHFKKIGDSKREKYLIPVNYF